MKTVRQHFTQPEINLYGNIINLQTLAEDPSQLSAFLDTLETEQKEEAAILLLYILSARPDVKGEHLMIIYKWITSYKNTIPYYFFLDCFFKTIDDQQKWDWLVKEIKIGGLEGLSILRTYFPYLFQEVLFKPGVCFKFTWKDSEWGLHDPSKEDREHFLKAWKQHDPDFLKTHLTMFIREIKNQPDADHKMSILKMHLKEISLDNMIEER